MIKKLKNLYPISGARIAQVFHSLKNIRNNEYFENASRQKCWVRIDKKNSRFLIAVRHIYKLFQLFWLLLFESKILPFPWNKN